MTPNHCVFIVIFTCNVINDILPLHPRPQITLQLFSNTYFLYKMYSLRTNLYQSLM